MIFKQTLIWLQHIKELGVLFPKHLDLIPYH